MVRRRELGEWGGVAGSSSLQAAEGFKFHNPHGPGACQACRSKESLPPAVAVTSETIRENLYLWRIGLWGGGLGKVRGRAFGEMVSPASVSPAASVPRSQEACSSLILGDKGPGNTEIQDTAPLSLGLGNKEKRWWYPHLHASGTALPGAWSQISEESARSADGCRFQGAPWS